MVYVHRISRAIFVLLVAGVIPACNGSMGNNGASSGSTPPSFDGVTSATPLVAAGDVALVWTPATDFSGTGILYDVFYAQGVLPTNSGTETFQFSTPNSDGVTVTGLESGKSYIFRVVAQDGTGAKDSNSAEAAAIAP